MNRSLRKTLHSSLWAAALVLLPSCAQRAWMMVPPKFDLGSYPRVGLVELDCSNPSMQTLATDRFQEEVLEGWSGFRLVLIDGEALGWTGEPGRPDSAALRELAEEQGLDAIFTGTLNFTEPAPSIGISSSLVEVTARFEVVGTMTVRLIDPESGATLWVRTAEDRATVASGGIDTEGHGSLGVTDFDVVRSQIVRSLASRVTDDLGAQYFRMRVEDIPPGYRLTYPDGVAVYVPPDEEHGEP